MCKQYICMYFNKNIRWINQSYRQKLEEVTHIEIFKLEMFFRLLPNNNIWGGLSLLKLSYKKYELSRLAISYVINFVKQTKAHNQL